MSVGDHPWYAIELSAAELGYDEGTVIEVQFLAKTADSIGVAIEAVRGSLEGLRASAERTCLLIRKRGMIHEVPAAGAFSIRFPYAADGMNRLQVAYERAMAALG